MTFKVTSPSQVEYLTLKKSLINTWKVLNGNERRMFCVLTFLGLIISILDIAFLAALIWLIQYFIQPTTTGFLTLWIEKNPLLTLGSFFLLFTSKNIAAYYLINKQYRFIGEVAIRVSGENLTNFQLAQYDEFIKSDSSEHIRKICFQPFEFAQYMLAGVQQVITQSFLVMAALTAILIFNPNVFLLLLLILFPPVAIIFYIIRRKSAAYKKEIQITNEQSFRYLLDALKGFVEGNIYGRNSFFHRRFIRHRRMFSESLFKSLSLQALPSRLIEIFAILGLFILVIIARTTAETGIDLITVAAFMAAAYKIIPGIVKIVNTSGQIKAYDFSLVELLPNKQENESFMKKNDRIHTIALSDVSFQYPGLEIAKNVTLEISKGDILGITGDSGVGKTTLINLVLGLLHPSKGSLVINNQVINNGDARNYWPYISYVRQQSFFLHDTIQKNITLEEEDPNINRLTKAMRISGLDELVNTWPNGLQTIIAENARSISGGQQQRLSIARAIYNDPDVFLLDEPFNELDASSAKNILDGIKEMAIEGKIIVLVTHQKELLSYCNKIMKMDD